LPVVAGGDAVTVVCRARFALPLVRAFALAFEKETKEKATIKAIADGGLTAAAGIVYVKPHHPFSVAGGLAGELTASAKRWKRAAGREVSSLDLHVAFESTLT
jgi:CRISPR/Cas system-associated protein Cas10 (large subunit of type III CRISPR-Cas system)